MLEVAIQSFSYEKKTILKNINFSIDAGIHLAVLGESGCGKSTLLHLIYGLLHLEKGSLFWNQKQLLGPKFNLIPGEPFMKLVAQEANVMPFISVEENVATFLSRQDNVADKQRVDQLLAIVELEDFSNQMVKTLSGGQKQRVALAKALAKKPEVILLDEPFSHIDTFKKNRLRRKLFNYLKEEGITCITATHDSQEALAFSDKILMLRDGKIERFDTPKKIFNDLQNEYQGGFFADVSSGFNGEHKVLLPHQIQRTNEKTSIQAVVVQSLFFGMYYIIEAHYNNASVFFKHPTKIPKGEAVFLKSIS